MKIKELLVDSSQWCQEWMAVDYYGFTVSPTCTTAARWSIVGAAIKCYGDKAQAVLDFMSIKTGNPNMGIWNMAATFEDVQKLIEEYDI